MYLGAYIAKFFSVSFANKLGASIIIILGLYFIFQFVFKSINKNTSKELALKDINDMIGYAEASDLDKSGDISIKEAIFIAFGLTFNNLGTGIAASITAVNIKITVIFTFILSFITIILGELIGTNIFGKVVGKYAPLFSGILLFILGVIELFY